MSLENDVTTELSVKDFLAFCTSCDRIPILGFYKSIDIHFTRENVFPKASTCGLILTLPLHVTAKMLSFCITEGGTFGTA